MTGRDLIIYILQNDLENEEVVQDGIFIGFMDVNEAATKFDVGLSTILAWRACGMIDGVTIGETLFFLKTLKDPRNK